MICTDGPDGNGRVTVYFGRSWTGMKVAEVKFLALGAGGCECEMGKCDQVRVESVVWEASEEMMEGQSEEEAKEMVKEMVKEALKWVMGVEVIEGERWGPGGVSNRSCIVSFGLAQSPDRWLGEVEPRPMTRKNPFKNKPPNRWLGEVKSRPTTTENPFKYKPSNR